jgi:hypothetical protein
VDAEDEIHEGKRNPLSFDADELKKTGVISARCSRTGERFDFDVIRREDSDDIMQTVANTTDKQSEDVAATLRDAMEVLNAVSPTG